MDISKTVPLEQLRQKRPSSEVVTCMCMRNVMCVRVGGGGGGGGGKGGIRLLGSFLLATIMHA